MKYRIYQQGGAMSDEELMDWACKNPEIVMTHIRANWATCGPGCREDFFNFRLAIKDAMLAARSAKAK